MARCLHDIFDFGSKFDFWVTEIVFFSIFSQRLLEQLHKRKFKYFFLIGPRSKKLQKTAKIGLFSSTATGALTKGPNIEGWLHMIKKITHANFRHLSSFWAFLALKYRKKRFL